MRRLADNIGATEGSEVRLILPFSGGSGSAAAGELSAKDESDPLGGTPKVIKGRSSGSSRWGCTSTIRSSSSRTLPSVQSFLNQGKRVTSFNIKLASGCRHAVGVGSSV